MEAKKILFFGRYPQTKTGGYRPIQWDLLRTKENHCLYVSHYALDVKPYHQELKDMDWLQSSLRYWLNNTFLATAFNEAERRALVRGLDDVFLLDKSAASNLLSDESCKCAPTNYAKKQCWCHDTHTAEGKPTCDWWLFDQGEYRCAMFVNGEGHINEAGNYVDVSSIGVRPAIWLDMDAEWFRDPSLRAEPPRSAAFRIELTCPECGGTTWYDVNDPDGAFECASCGEIAMQEDMGETRVEHKPFGHWLRPKDSTPKSYRYQCSVCGEIVHQAGNNGRKVKDANPKCTYRCCPFCMSPMVTE